MCIYIYIYILHIHTSFVFAFASVEASRQAGLHPGSLLLGWRYVSNAT